MLLPSAADVPAFIVSTGYFAVFATIFAESGILVGFFLPGDSLLVSAGVLAAQGYLRVEILLIGCIGAAVLGDNVGYRIGRVFGPRVFVRRRSLFFDPEHVDRARAFYARYGGAAVVIARFFPIIRTLAPILAGVGHMPYRRFAVYNVAGGTLWAGGLLLAGYSIGTLIPDVDRYLLPVIGGIVLLSLAPSLVQFARRGGIGALARRLGSRARKV